MDRDQKAANRCAHLGLSLCRRIHRVRTFQVRLDHPTVDRCRLLSELTSRFQSLAHVHHAGMPLAQLQKRPRCHDLTLYLPPEVIGLVFQLLPFRARVRSAQVCSRWRRISLDAHALLWSTIRWHDGQRACTLRWLLERAKTSHITLRLSLDGSRVGVVIDSSVIFKELVVPRLHHIQRLSICNTDFPANQVELLSQFLCCSAPQLELVELLGRMPGDKAKMQLPCNLFGGNAPRLRFAFFGAAFSLPMHCPALSGLVHLELHTSRFEEMASLDNMCPDLKRLRISGNLAEQQRGTFSRLLTHLTVKLSSPASTDLLQYFAYKRISHLSTCFYETALSDLLPPANDCRALMLLVLFSGITLELRDAPGRVVRLSEVPGPRLLEFPAFSYIKALEIHELWLVDFLTIPLHLPRLRYLAIGMMDHICHGEAYRRHILVEPRLSVFHRGRSEQPLLICPSLRRLSITPRIMNTTPMTQRLPWILAPEDLLDFILHRLHLADHRQLDVLELYRVDILVHVPLLLSRLLDTVQSLSVRKDEPIVPYFSSQMF